MKEIEIKVVTTIKVQSIEDGKKITRRRFNVDVKLPKVLQVILNSYAYAVAREVLAENMSPKEWVSLIKKYTRSKQLRSWAASVIWWKYFSKRLGQDSILYKLATTFNPKTCQLKVKQLMILLERMGCPKSVNNFAAKREKIRIGKIEKFKKDGEKR